MKIRKTFVVAYVALVIVVINLKLNLGAPKCDHMFLMFLISEIILSEYSRRRSDKSELANYFNTPGTPFATSN